MQCGYNTKLSHRQLEPAAKMTNTVRQDSEDGPMLIATGKKRGNVWLYLFLDGTLRVTCRAGEAVNRFQGGNRNAPQPATPPWTA